MERFFYPAVDFVHYCLLDSYLFEETLFMLLIVAVTVAIGTLVLYGVMRVVKPTLAFTESARLCLLAGVASFLAAYVTSLVDFCFYIFNGESVQFAVVTLVSLIAPIGLLRRHVHLPLWKAALVGVPVLAVSYIIAALAFGAIYILPGT